MKYFTPELWLQTQSGVDSQTYLAAYETWERNIDAYEQQLARIIPRGRRHDGLRQFAQQESLHDATVLGCWFTSASRLSLLVQPEATPERLICLDYVVVSHPQVIPNVLPSEYRTPHLRWLYDEVDVLPDTLPPDEPVFTHDVLLGNGCELVISFLRMKVSEHRGLLSGVAPTILSPARVLSRPA